MIKIPELKIKVGILFLLLFSWSILLMFNSFWFERDSTVFRKVPNDANLVFKVNGAQIIKSSLFTVLLEARDPQLMEIIDEAIKKKRKYTGPSKNIGVDWLNDFVVFTISKNKQSILGISANLKSQNLLRQNADNYFDNFSTYANDDKHIVILKYRNKTNPKPDLAYLQKKAERILKMKKKEWKAIPGNPSLTLSTESGFLGENSIFCSSNINFFENLHTLNIHGELTFNQKNASQIAKSAMLVPKGFHFHSQIIPPPIQLEIQTQLLRIGLKTPPIAALGLNYFGSEIKNTKKGLRISPDMELLLHFKQPIDLAKTLSENPTVNENGWYFLNDKLTNDIVTFHLHKIDDHTYVFIKELEDLKLSGSKTSLAALSGNPKEALKLSGDPFIVGFIQMFQLYKSSNELFSKTRSVDIQLKMLNSKKAYINAVYLFKRDAYPLNEVLKFAITNQLIDLRN